MAERGKAATQTKRFAAAALLAGLAVMADGAEPSSAPLTPEEALRAFQFADGLRVELVAAEPLVASPCALAFDERGRLYVAENRGYPIGPPSPEKPAGVIALLEDTDADGRMDKRTVVADGLTFPNGVLPWKGGVIVTCAPDVLYLRDSDGDGRADERRVLLTGFDTKGSTQLRVNCPTLGPDGWIYLAAGLSGGQITCPSQPERPALKMTADLRFHPETLEVENVDGRSQYGMSFDDFGRRFICMNRVPVQHVVLESKWLRRNPHLAFSDTVQDCNERSVKTGLRGGGDGVRLFPISANITTADSHAGSFSAACGIMIWRGGALPEQYRGCAFTCDPTANLVHVDKLVPRGATFSAEPLLKDREFLASRDDWFRPVFLASGPDGALYVCDMYRKSIEHPDYLPEEIRKRTDFESGKSMGRIWRVVAVHQPARVTVAQPSPQEDQWLNEARPIEPQAAQQWLDTRLAAATSPDARTRFLAALVLGNVQAAASTEALAKIAARDADDRWARAAALSGLAGRAGEFLDVFLAENENASEGALDLLVELGRAFPDVATLHAALERTHSAGAGRAGMAPKLAALVAGTSERSKSKLDIHAEAWLSQLFDGFLRDAADQQTPRAHRLLYVKAIACANWSIAGSTLRALATDEPDDGVRTMAIRALAGFSEPEVGRTLLARDRWPGYTPALRETVLGALLSRAAHLPSVLAAVELGALPASALDRQRRELFLKHKDPAIRERAEKLFSTATAGDRQKAFEAAKSALALPANAAHGRDVFKSLCATCHRLEREGFAVGPDLLDIRNQPKESILFHIVVPEAEVAPAFAAYLVETKDGRALSGILASETPTAITLRLPLGLEETILRANIAKLEALPNSLMPPLEGAMSGQNLADLLGFLKGESAP